jgi:hypothetical protein
MRAEAEMVCQLPQTGHRRGLPPGDGDLQQDICDISMWLAHKHQVPLVHLWVDKHHFQSEYQVACVAVMLWGKHLDQMTRAAQAAFLALDYEIHDTGADVFALQCCDGAHSNHEVLRAYTRIETVFRRKRVMSIDVRRQARFSDQHPV